VSWLFHKTLKSFQQIGQQSFDTPIEAALKLCTQKALKTPLQDSVGWWATDCLTLSSIASMAVSASIGNAVMTVASKW
jgi:hypothetical protein